MNEVRYMTKDELIDKALLALMQALGPIETMRFLSRSRPTRMESVERHRKW